MSLSNSDKTRKNKFLKFFIKSNIIGFTNKLQTREHLVKIAFNRVPKNLFHLLNHLPALGLDSTVVVIQSLGQEGNWVRQNGQIVLALLVQEHVDHVQDEQSYLKWDLKISYTQHCLDVGFSLMGCKLIVAKNCMCEYLFEVNKKLTFFQGDPTIFHKGIFLKQTPHIKKRWVRFNNYFTSYGTIALI